MQTTHSSPDIIHSRLGPEERLLVWCARVAAGTANANDIAVMLGQSIDWEHLIRTAQVHGMLPHLHWCLCNGGNQGVPEAVLGRLQDEFRRNTWRNVFLTGELLRIVEQLSSHGVPAIPFKGPSLASLLYGSVALRQFVDLDILVREQDVMTAKALLMSQGYRPQFKLTDDQVVAILRTDNELAFTREDRACVVDLQWKFRPEYFSFPLEMEPLWDRARPIPLAGVSVPSLSPEDLLLFLCVHGAKHVWGGLIAICDLARLLVVHPQMDWDYVMEQAGTVRSKRMLFLGLLLANDFLGVPLPGEVVRQARADSRASALALRVTRELFRSEVPAGVLETCVFHLRSRESLRDRIHYCFHLAASQTERDWRLVSLPAALSPFYYILRPIRLIGKYGLQLIRPSNRTR